MSRLRAAHFTISAVCVFAMLDTNQSHFYLLAGMAANLWIALRNRGKA